MNETTILSLILDIIGAALLAWGFLSAKTNDILDSVYTARSDGAISYYRSKVAYQKLRELLLVRLGAALIVIGFTGQIIATLDKTTPLASLACILILATVGFPLLLIYHQSVVDKTAVEFLDRVMDRNDGITGIDTIEISHILAIIKFGPDIDYSPDAVRYVTTIWKKRTAMHKELKLRGERGRYR